MQFITNPNFPKRAVKVAAVARPFAHVLADYGITPLSVEPSKALPQLICDHADMQVFHLGGGRVVVAPEQHELISSLKEYGFDAQVCAPLGDKYPQDCKLNAVLLGNTVFGRLQSLAPQVLHTVKQKINVNQGYTRCSVCLVNETAAITADTTLALALRTRGVDVLQICAGHIELMGYDYGFIGGASALIDKDRLLFFGDITKHPDYPLIHSFLQKHNITEVHSQGPLTDIGGMVPLMEKRTTV